MSTPVIPPNGVDYHPSQHYTMVSKATKGDWKDFVNLIQNSPNCAIALEDHDVVVKIIGDGAILLAKESFVERHVHENLLGLLLRGNVDNRFIFYACLLSGRTLREAVVIQELFQEAMECETDKENNRPKLPIFIYGNTLTAIEYYRLGFKFQSWALDYCTYRDVSLRKVRKSGWREGIMLMSPMAVDPEKLADYDKKITGGIPRYKYLDYWITRHQIGTTKVALDSESGEICGFGMVREIPRSFPGFLAVGPLYADDEATAKALLFGLLYGYGRLRHRSVGMYMIHGDERGRRLFEECFEAQPIFESIKQHLPMISGPSNAKELASTGFLKPDLGRIFGASDPHFMFI